MNLFTKDIMYLRSVKPSAKVTFRVPALAAFYLQGPDSSGLYHPVLTGPAMDEEVYVLPVTITSPRVMTLTEEERTAARSGFSFVML